MATKTTIAFKPVSRAQTDGTTNTEMVAELQSVDDGENHGDDSSSSDHAATTAGTTPQLPGSKPSDVKLTSAGNNANDGLAADHGGEANPQFAAYSDYAEQNPTFRSQANTLGSQLQSGDVAGAEQSVGTMLQDPNLPQVSQSQAPQRARYNAQTSAPATNTANQNGSAAAGGGNASNTTAGAGNGGAGRAGYSTASSAPTTAGTQPDAGTAQLNADTSTVTPSTTPSTAGSGDAGDSSIEPSDGSGVDFSSANAQMLIQWVLTQVHREATAELKDVATKLQFQNNLRKQCRVNANAARTWAAKKSAGADKPFTEPFVLPPKPSTAFVGKTDVAYSNPAGQATDQNGKVLGADGKPLDPQPEMPKDADHQAIDQKQIDAYIEEQENLANNAGDDAQLTTIKLQQITQAVSMAVETKSNLMKAYHDASMTITRNIGA